MKELQSDYFIVALDWPGFGQSTPPPSTADIAWYSQCLTGFANKLNLTPIAYIGHSFGVRVLLHLYGTNPGKFIDTKLVCIGGAGIATKSLKKSAFLILSKPAKLVRYLLPTSIFNKLRGSFYHMIGSDYASSGQMSVVYKNIIDYDLREVSSRIIASTLLIYGEDDRATPVAHGKEFQKQIKHSRLEVVKDADHFVHQNHVNEVAVLIRQHLQYD